MRVAYFDCFAGASGDMILGSLLDAGLDIAVLRHELSKLRLTHYDIQAEPMVKGGITGAKASVLIDREYHREHHRRLKEIREIIEQSGLHESIKEQALRIFMRLAEAEAAVHHKSVDEIHFHEVGAMDAIIDVVGAVAGLRALGVERVYCSPMHVGAGYVVSAHGILPIPAPATSELIQGRPVFSTGVEAELLTPTGAAILTVLAHEFGPMPSMVPAMVGYGAGTADLPIPNLLRVFIGEAEADIASAQVIRTAIIETTIDDMNPQIYDYVFRKVLEAGALDVFLVPVQMKKNRPGSLLTVVCPVDRVESLARLLMTETTTIGVRWRIDRTIKASVTQSQVKTPYGPVKVKIARIGERIVHIAPEYDDCKRLALLHDTPLKRIMDEALLATSRAFQSTSFTGRTS